MSHRTQPGHLQALTKDRFDCFVRVEGEASNPVDERLPGWYRIEVQMERGVNPSELSDIEKGRIATIALYEFHDHHGIEVPEDFEITVILETGHEVVENEGPSNLRLALNVRADHHGKVCTGDLPEAVRRLDRIEDMNSVRATGDSDMVREQCNLPPSGGTVTMSEVGEWVDAVAERLNAADAAPFMAKVWPYRYGGMSFIACDIEGAKRSGESITFKLGGRHDFHQAEPVVPDAVEAIHMIGLLTRRLGTAIEIGR